MSIEQEEKLQAAYEEQAARTAARWHELEACKGELAGIVSKLVDSDQKARPGLVTRRAELVNLRDLLTDELEELQAREDAAYLARFIYAEDQARAECSRLGESARIARLKMQAASDAELHFRNRKGRAVQSEEDNRDLVNHAVEKARAIAESQIAARNAERAAAELARAQGATAAARAELKAPEPVAQ